MSKRKIEAILQEWKNQTKRKPLIVKGVRQCGKTSSVQEFAQKNYEQVIYLNFHEKKSYKAFFSGDLDVETITTNIALGIIGTQFVSGKTCLIFDEIQDCPRARASLKFFCLDGRYDVLCTGSLLGVNGYKTKEEQQEEEEASIPVGFEEIVYMYPMDFEEWLWANGIRSEQIDILRQHLADEKPLNETFHNRFRQLLLQYVFIGGMPEVVEKFLTTHNMGETRKVQLSIIDSYESDMIKYASAVDKPRIRECFESIPKQLARDYKKFTYSVIRPNAKGRDYAGSLQWIEDAGIIHRCYNTQITELPLEGVAIKDQFKVYMADTGLLISMLEEGTAWSIMQ